MRKLGRVLLGAGLLAASCGMAAGHEVKIWTPTPVKAVAPLPQVAENKVKVVSVVVVNPVGWRYGGRDWVHGSRYTGFTRVYSGPLYPF